MTTKELNEKSDVDVILNILQEKRRKIVPYSPLGVRLDNIISKLFWDRQIKE